MIDCNIHEARIFRDPTLKKSPCFGEIINYHHFFFVDANSFHLHGGKSQRHQSRREGLRQLRDVTKFWYPNQWPRQNNLKHPRQQMVHLWSYRSLRLRPEVEDHCVAEIHAMRRTLTGPRTSGARFFLGPSTGGYPRVLAGSGDG